MSAAPRLVDLRLLGQERVIGTWVIGDVIVDPGPTSGLSALLDALDGRAPRAVLLTHIHLDHAGATGSLVERWPDLEVYVHEVGARHLVDPTRLLESARRLYGENMDRLWGETLPVPEGNVRELAGGERLLGDRFEVAYTPGHASHHVAYLCDGVAYVGDVAGVRIGGGLAIPPTPPPDVDVEAWHESLAAVAAWRPARLAMMHFGSSDDVEAQLREVGRRLDAWARLARDTDRDGFMAAVRKEIAAGAPAEEEAAYALAAPHEQLYAGLERYWRKRAG